MNFSKSLLTLCAFFLLHSQLFSQKIDPDGYYIGLKGDTVYGRFIDYQEYIKSPSSVSFQPSSSTQTIDLTPDKCLTFSVNHFDTYISFTGKRLANETDYRLAPANLPDVYEDVSIFMKELFNNGHYRLYMLKDGKRMNFYTSDETGTLKELYYKAYSEDGSVIESAVFRQQLSFLFIDQLDKNTNAQNSLEKLSYSEEALVKFFTVVTNTKVLKTKNKYPSEFFAGLGASLNMFNVAGDKTLQSNFFGTYSSEISPVLEAGIRVFSQRKHGNLFFTARLNAYQYKNSGTFTDFAGDITSDTFRATVISFPLSFGYKFIHNENYSLAASVGVAGLILIDNVQDGQYDTGHIPFHTNNDAGFVAISPFVEAELQLKKKLSFYTGYYIPTSVSGNAGYAARHSSLKLGVRYDLF